jgi:nitrogen regulatory protein PII
MSYLVVLIVDDAEKVSEILRGWEKAGALGVTIIESMGLGRLRRAGLRDDLPLIPSLRNLLEAGEVHHRTLFSVVETQETVDKMAASAQRVIGDLEEAHTGFMFVLPVLQAIGMGKHRSDRTGE